MTIKASSYPTSRPTLDLNFAQTKRLDPRVTFTRSSTGTYFDANGVLQSAATNTARFDHNPATGESLGLLVEEARTNSQTYSNYSLGFSTSNAGVMQDNATVAPDGSFTALRATRFTWGRPINTTGAQSYSVYVKQDSSPTVAMGVSGYGNPWTFTFATKTLTPLNGSWTVSYTELPNGWFRINAVTSLTLGSTYYFYETSASTTSVFVWGAQLEAGSFPTSYIPTPATFTSRASSATYYDANGVIQTANTNVARSAAFFPNSNGVMRSAGLLLEAAGTNLQLNSAAPYTSGGTGLVWTTGQASLDGGSGAVKIVEDSSNGYHTAQVNEYPASFPTATYTYSVFAKASGRNRFSIKGPNLTHVTFDLSTGTVVSGAGGTIVRAPNGWWRCSVTEATSNGFYQWFVNLNSNTGSGYQSYAGDGTSGVILWGWQMEASPYPTSYIATTTATVTRSADVSSSATVTRSADVASITGTNFSSWYNQNEGTTLAKTKNLKGLSAPHIITFTNAASDEMALYGNTSTPYAQAYGNIVAIGQQWNMTKNSTDPSSSAFAYKANDVSFVVSGGSASLDTSALIPTVDRFVFCADVNGAGRTSGHVSRLTYWPTRLSDATLQAITQ